jgi:hypothetical protein
MDAAWETGRSVRAEARFCKAKNGKSKRGL